MGVNYTILFLVTINYRPPGSEKNYNCIRQEHLGVLSYSVRVIWCKMSQSSNSTRT